jgi:hypothetical protein
MLPTAHVPEPLDKELELKLEVLEVEPLELVVELNEV